jgi:phospholipase C
MDRRTFLKTTGAAVAAAPFLTAQPGATQIQHVVVCMLENRSFDHLFGWLPNASGRQAGLSYVDTEGNSHATFPLAPDFTGCDYDDPDHSYSGGRLEYDNGKMDGFLQPASNSVYAIGYYQEKDLPFRAALARNYTTCDRYFPSILGPTFPNRIFQYAGQTDRLDDDLSICTLPTIWDNLQAKGVSHKYYFNNLPIVALWGLKYLSIANYYSDFLSDCAAGTLPSVSFVDPSFTLIENLAEDDHPHSDVRNGDAFLAQTFQAVSSGPNWPNTVFIVNFDEWGGFFDTIVPPRAIAPNGVDTDLVDGKALLGIRVPCIIASPWTRGNPADPAVNSTVFDHTSVLKLIETIWDVPPLAARETSTDVGNLLSVLNPNNYDAAVPTLPSPRHVIPSSFCSSSLTSAPITGDREPTVFQKMIENGMLAGFPGY